MNSKDSKLPPICGWAMFHRMYKKTDAMREAEQKKQESKMEQKETENRFSSQAEREAEMDKIFKETLGDPKDWRIGACATPFLQQMDLDSASQQDKEK